jgi:hypothetical protein
LLFCGGPFAQADDVGVFADAVEALLIEFRWTVTLENKNRFVVRGGRQV